MTAIVALDLDQTTIYSATSAEPLDGTPTVWVEDHEGATLSLMTVRAHRLLAALALRHTVLPVTTRTPEQLARVRLPLPDGYAVACNGGVLLHGGARDAGWDARVRAELGTVAPASEAWEELAGVADQPWVRSVRRVEELFVYLVAQNRSLIEPSWIAGLTEWGSRHGWGVSVQGRKIYLVPAPLRKGVAAQRVADLLGGPLLAAGDSLLDRDLLEAAAVSVRPRHGELQAQGWTCPGLVVTNRSGARAAEEVLEVLGAAADRLAPSVGG